MMVREVRRHHDRQRPSALARRRGRSDPFDLLSARAHRTRLEHDAHFMGVRIRGRRVLRNRPFVSLLMHIIIHFRIRFEIVFVVMFMCIINEFDG